MTQPNPQVPEPPKPASEVDRRIQWALAMLEAGALNDYYSAYGLS